MLQAAAEINAEYLSKRENRIAYLKAQKLANHEKAVVEQAVDEALAKAIPEANAKTAAEMRRQLAITMLSDKEPIEKILKYSNVNISQINEIRTTLNL